MVQELERTDGSESGGAGRLAGPGARIAGVLGVGLVAIVVIVVAVLFLVHRGESLPGTRVQQVDVGGLSAADVRARLDPYVQRLAGRTVTVTAPGDRQYPVTATQAGFNADVDGTVAAVMDRGRDGNPLQRMWANVAVSWRDLPVSLENSFDKTALRQRVEAIAADADRDPFPGALAIDGTTVTARPPVDGFTTDRDAAYAATLDALGSPATATLELPGAIQPVNVDPAAVEAVAEQARGILSAPLELTGDGETVELSAAKVGPLLSAEVAPAAKDSEDGAPRAVSLGLDTEALTKLVSHRTDQLNVTAKNATLTASGAPVVDAKGDLTYSPQPAAVTVTGRGRTGRSVDVDKTAANARTALLAGAHTADLVIDTVEPDVSTEDAQSVDQVIGTFTTHYVAGQPRVTNIHRIADIVDGTVIPAGSKFSLNGVAGKRTPEKGFVKDGAILGGELVDQYGGGVSQFSTTTFNAAFFAGLPINDYKAHSFYISRYPPGREATLNFPTIDLVWTNDTGHPILVKTSYTATSITVALYGDNGGRVVSAHASPREQVSGGGGGFRIAVTRTINGGGSSDSRTFHTRYVDSPE